MTCQIEVGNLKHTKLGRDNELPEQVLKGEEIVNDRQRDKI